MSKIINQSFILMRLNKPVGIYLLLWPTLWGLWLAAEGIPSFFVLFVFISGVVLMRSAGCVINDIADRKWDRYVTRTRDRPLTSGKMTTRAALILFFLLLGCAFFLVLQLNVLTIQLAFIAAAVAVIYPFMKRFTHLPQLGMGVAFSLGIPMAFAAESNTIPLRAWILFLAAMIWPIMYDTLYAMADREDDKKIGIKSTAILFEKWDRPIIGFLQILFLAMMLFVGSVFQLHRVYYASLALCSGFFIYQQILIYSRSPEGCLQAFLNNQWVGFMLFSGIFLNYL